MPSRARAWASPLVGLAFVLSALTTAAAPTDPADAGLAALDALDFEAALPLLESAVQAQPDDALLHYAIGVAETELGRDEAAAKALQRAAELDPLLPGVQAELGLALYRIGDLSGAEEHLVEALLQGPEDADVLLHLGLLDAEHGEPDRALRFFEEAATVDPDLAAAAWLEAAGVALERDDMAAAEQYLERAVAAAGPEPARREAMALLSLLEPVPQRWIALAAGAGIEYDDNLSVSAADLTTGIDDVAAVLDASIDLFPVHRSGVDVAIGYGFYQSLYRRVTELDLQSHSPYLRLTAGDDRLRGGASYRFTRDGLGGSGFLSTHRGDLDAELRVAPWLTGLAGVRIERLLFDDTPERDLKRLSVAVGARVVDARDAATLSVLWRPVWAAANGSEFDYHGDVVTTRLGVDLRAGDRLVDLHLTHEWEERDYDNPTASIGARRHDSRHVFGAGVAIPLIGPTDVSLDYLHVSSSSNLRELDYGEDIVTLRFGAYY